MVSYVRLRLISNKLWEKERGRRGEGGGKGVERGRRRKARRLQGREGDVRRERTGRLIRGDRKRRQLQGIEEETKAKSVERRGQTRNGRWKEKGRERKERME